MCTNEHKHIWYERQSNATPYGKTEGTHIKAGVYHVSTIWLEL